MIIELTLLIAGYIAIIPCFLVLLCKMEGKLTRKDIVFAPLFGPAILVVLLIFSPLILLCVLGDWAMKRWPRKPRKPNQYWNEPFITCGHVAKEQQNAQSPPPVS